MSSRSQPLEVQRSARFAELTEEQARAVTGGASSVYYDVSTGRYILVPKGSVYVGPGLLVGET